MIGNEPRMNTEEETWERWAQRATDGQGAKACGEPVLIGACVVNEKVLDNPKMNSDLLFL